MRRTIFLLLQFVTLIGYSQGTDSLSFTPPSDTDEVFLIEPIIESPVMNRSAMLRHAKNQTVYKNWGIEATDLQKIIEGQSARGTSVCICDTGTPLHQDLSDAIGESENFTTEPFDHDQNGHSTHVGGIVHEIAPAATLYFAKVLTSRGGGSMRGVAAGVRWCVEKNVDVINLSLGARSGNPELYRAIQSAIDTNIVVVVAAGNDGQHPEQNRMGWPARYPETIAVGSINFRFEVSPFSSSGDEGDIMAPGESILATHLDNNYIVLSGTSMAAPYISGVAALFISKYGRRKDIPQYIIDAAIDIDPDGFDRNSFHGWLNPTHLFAIDKDTIEQEPPDEISDQPQSPVTGSKGWRYWPIILILTVVLALIAMIVILRRNTPS